MSPTRIGHTRIGPTRIGDKYKEVIKKLSDDLKEEGGNTKKIEKLNKSTPYVELFIEHLRKNPDILNKYFNISEDDDSEIINIWDKINDLKILEKINLDENKITEIKLPRNLVKSSTVLSLANIPVVIDLHNTQIQPIGNRGNYQYNTVSFPLHRNNSIILANQGSLPQYPQFHQFSQHPPHLRHSQIMQHPPHLRHSQIMQHPPHLRHSQIMQYPPHLRHSQIMQYPQHYGYPHYAPRSAPHSAPPLAPHSAPPLAPHSAPPLAPPSAPHSVLPKVLQVTKVSKLDPRLAPPKVLQVKPVQGGKVTDMINNDVNGYRNILSYGGKSKNKRVMGITRVTRVTSVTRVTRVTEAKVKETKILFTKLLKSNKYIKYNKHLYVRYDKYLLSVPVLIAYITYNKKSKRKKINK